LTLIEENLRQNSSGHLGLTGTLADYTTTVSDYQTVKELLVPFYTTMVLTFKATDNDLHVKVMGDRGD
jgi:hypothetical protein